MPDGVESGVTTVALSISRERNRALLVDLLDDHQVVDLTDPVPDATDICIVDERAFRTNRARLVDWRAAQHPVYAPVLLLCESSSVDPWTRYADDIGEGLDAIQPIPASRAAIVAQIEALLETRQYAVQLADERDRSTAIFEGSFDAMVLADDDGVYTDANAAAADLFGVPRETLIGGRLSDFATGNLDYDGALLQFEDQQQERGTVELERPDGTQRVVEYSTTADVVPGRHLSILRDITERLEYEAQLREQHDRLETILTNAPVVLFAFDSDGRYTFVAGQGLSKTGVAADELVGETFRTAMGDQSDAISMMERALGGEEVHGSVRLGGRDFEVWARPTVTDGDPEPGQPAVIGVAMDVTLTRAAEAEARARQDQIAFFNSLLRHEALNGLAVVLGNISVLVEELPDDHELAPNVDRIDSRSKDIAETVRRIRTVLAKLTVTEPEVTVHDLADVVRDRVKQVRSDYPHAEVQTEIPEHAPVYADSLLGDVVYNVVSNAIQHNDRDTPEIDVTVRAGVAETVFVVADNGPGIPETVLTAISGQGGAEQTWTTVGSFGLYFVKTMVERYDGTLDIRDRTPRGTEMEIRLPSAPNEEPDT